MTPTTRVKRTWLRVITIGASFAIVAFALAFMTMMAAGR